MSKSTNISRHHCISYMKLLHLLSCMMMMMMMFFSSSVCVGLGELCFTMNAVCSCALILLYFVCKKHVATTTVMNNQVITNDFALRHFTSSHKTFSLCLCVVLHILFLSTSVCCHSLVISNWIYQHLWEMGTVCFFHNGTVACKHVTRGMMMTSYVEANVKYIVRDKLQNAKVKYVHTCKCMFRSRTTEIEIVEWNCEDLLEKKILLHK